jgi:4-hydroxy-tetrahydrodipicolinate synthase
MEDAMKYTRSEAKDAAREILKGVWTAMPYCWDAADEFDDAANRANMEHIVSGLEIDGHYCSGNIAEFWSMPNAERMHAHEVMIDAASGRIPQIAGCHHQSVKDATMLANHAWDVGFDFVIVLTPYIAAGNDDSVFAFYEYICERTDIGIVLFNVPHNCHPIGPDLARRLVELPNIVAIKQADPAPASTFALEAAVGDKVVISVADEAPWLHNMTQLGHQWLINYNPHLYQVPGYLPIRDYTALVQAGDIAGATKLAATLKPLRELHAEWIQGYWRKGRMPMSEMKYWQECIGMAGGPVRPPVLPMSEAAQAQFRADLDATGLPARLAGLQTRNAAE